MDSSSIDVAEISRLVDTLSHSLKSLIAQLRQQREKNIIRKQPAEEGLEEIEPSEKLADGEVQKAITSSDQVIADAVDACKQLKTMTTVTSRPQIRRCPVPKQTTDQEDLEHDFTTPGVQGNLGCPFAKMAQNGRPITPNSTIDPIAVEFHQDRASIQAPPTAPQSSGCPIRFLDQHSPEEVAKYFENHKHEIPRSHEVCVKRYQQNERSIRELDQKYGNTVNMIQGLGVKHKQYLSEKNRRQSIGNEQSPSSTRAVEQWAQNISEIPEEAIVDTDNELEREERCPHFSRPLRDIRVGESPSRPWGISVPPITTGEKQTASTPAGDRGIEPTSLALLKTSLTLAAAPTTATPSRPIDQERMSKPKGDTDVPAEAPASKKIEAATAMRPARTTFWGPAFFESASAMGLQAKNEDLHFMGPAFFGWPAEKVTSFLRETN